MDPNQVIRGEDGGLRCRDCGFTYDLAPAGIIRRTHEGLDAVSEAVASASPSLWDRRPAPEIWSINEYATHLAVAAEVISGRVRAVVEHDRPTLPYYDQDADAAEVGYNRFPAGDSVARLRPTVEAFVADLAALPADAWERTGVHAIGAISLRSIAHDMPHELLHHADDIRRVGAELRDQP